MRKKPSGKKYRNLTARGGVIYYERVLDGKRVRFSTETDEWDEAAAVRDLYERERLRRATRPGEVPTFKVMAARYLAEAAGHLSGSTREDRERLLGDEGTLTAYFGGMKLDAVGRRELLEWWHLEVEGRGRKERTGLTFLSALSGVFGYAVDLEVLEANPIDSLRGTLRRRRRSKGGRAADEERRDNIRPLDASELAAFIEASERAGSARFKSGKPKRERRHGHVADLLQLDAGLRLGEAAGLRWGDVEWGDGPKDTSRALVIQHAISRGKHAGPPKSGRKRRVALSRRLRRTLRDLWVEAGQPKGSEPVLPGFHQGNYRARHFAEVCRAAELEGRTPKDLRDTFASQLLTAGVQLGYISRQLGHVDVATTAHHYARWAGGTGYVRAIELRPGEVPADVLARLVQESPHKSPHLAEEGIG